MNGFYAQLIQILKKNGFVFKRPGKGAHEIWHKGNISVSVSTNCYSKHTVNAILKDAGIDQKI